MGGDAGPPVTVPAALRMSAHADIVLVGAEDRIVAVLEQSGAAPDAPRLSILHASEQIHTGDPLAQTLRHKRDASMRRALALVADGSADAVVSGGDTGALMALSRQILRCVQRIDRPAICKALQGVAGPFWMLDLGANVDCSPSQLQQFAHMGDALARAVAGLQAPRVALLNIGTEAAKGPRRLHEAARLLDADDRLRYVGYVEGHGLFRDQADVVVTDGFTGNVALKSMEGAAWMAGQLVRRWFDALGLAEREALAPARGQLESLRRELDPQGYNGASFVGLAGVVVKSHGGADTAGFASAIDLAIREVRGDLCGLLVRHFPA
jgi:glycerol-3-phosphate acyltransferase PlsX